MNLKKMGDSLLTRSNKVSELIGTLEAEIGKKPDSVEAKRAEKSGPNHHINLSRCWALRSVKALEECLAAISTQYEAVEATKVDVLALKNATDMDDSTKKSAAHSYYCHMLVLSLVSLHFPHPLNAAQVDGEGRQPDQIHDPGVPRLCEKVSETCTCNATRPCFWLARLRVSLRCSKVTPTEQTARSIVCTRSAGFQLGPAIQSNSTRRPMPEELPEADAEGVGAEPGRIGEFWVSTCIAWYVFKMFLKYL